MRESTHYELNLVEGTDKVNPLVQDVPNYETIDEAMYNNKCASIGIATELRTGTVHALVRQNEDAPMFRFTATSNYASGDTFTVDGVQVSALLVDGTPLPNMAYIIGSEVLCVLKGTLMTVFANRTTASDSDKLGGQLPAYYATDADLDALEGVVNAHTDQITQISNNLTHTLTQWGETNTSALFEHDTSNKIVDFVLNVFGNGVLNGETIATLPPAMRPPTNATFDVFGIQDDNNIHLLYCTIYTSGVVNIASSNYNGKIMSCTALGKFKTV